MPRVGPIPLQSIIPDDFRLGGGLAIRLECSLRAPDKTNAAWARVRELRCDRPAPRRRVRARLHVACRAHDSLWRAALTTPCCWPRSRLHVAGSAQRLAYGRPCAHRTGSLRVALCAMRTASHTVTVPLPPRCGCPAPATMWRAALCAWPAPASVSSALPASQAGSTARIRLVSASAVRAAPRAARTASHTLTAPLRSESRRCEAGRAQPGSSRPAADCAQLGCPHPPSRPPLHLEPWVMLYSLHGCYTALTLLEALLYS